MGAFRGLGRLGRPILNFCEHPEAPDKSEGACCFRLCPLKREERTCSKCAYFELPRIERLKHCKLITELGVGCEQWKEKKDEDDTNFF
jgi:hypothetical protein